jgi:hypothetical protein
MSLIYQLACAYEGFNAQKNDVMKYYTFGIVVGLSHSSVRVSESHERGGGGSSSITILPIYYDIFTELSTNSYSLD